MAVPCTTLQLISSYHSVVVRRCNSTPGIGFCITYVSYRNKLHLFERIVDRPKLHCGGIFRTVVDIGKVLPVY